MHKNRINGKMYIGITGMIPKYRWRNGEGYNYNSHFYRSIKKYGWNEGFDHIILIDGLTKNEAEQKEIELIAKYDTTNPDKGYNIGVGGGIVESKKVYQYNRQTGLLIKVWDNTIAIEKVTGMANTHISAVCLGKMKTAYDCYFSYNDYGDKLPNNILTYINTNNCFRRIAQYDLNGNFLNEYKSLSDARKIIGKNITMKGNTSYGYIWKYIDKNNKNTYKDKLKENELYFLNEPHYNCKPCNRYTLDGIYIGTFISTTEAAKRLNIKQNNIAAACRGEYFESNGYIWRYVDDVDSTKNLDKEELKQLHIHKASIPIIQYDKQGNKMKEYNSVTEASVNTNIPTTNISKCCKRKLKSAGGYIWRYKNESLTDEEILEINIHRRKRKIAQYTMDNQYVTTYESLAEASRKTGTRESSISACCRGRYKYANNFKWKYVQ